jgi:SNF2 family DNA or RNA helicase
MNTNYSIKNGQVINNANRSVATVAEYWEYADGLDVSPDGFQMLGYALPYLTIEDESSPTLQLGLRTEVGNLLLPSSYVFPSDHYVISNYWIPLNPEALASMKACLAVREIRIGNILSVFDFLYLVTSANNSKLDLKYESGIERNFDNLIADASIGENLAFTPYDYQLTGMRWLGSLFAESIGGLLCDEMGLGKTLQAIGLVERIQRNRDQSVLLCVPNSLIINWSREFTKFAPQIDIHVYQGPDRYLQPAEFEKLQIVLTTYELLVRDYSVFQKKSWNALICDEAQFLKNPDSQRSQTVSRFPAKTKFLLTGTPVENSLKDLWTLSDIVYPGILGSRKAFWNLVDDNPVDAYRIGRGVSPLIKRRLVKDVLTDLPDISTIDHVISPNRDFAMGYENIRLRRSEISAGADSRTVFLRLRQYCCHPDLVGEGSNILEVPKFSRLREIVEEIASSDQKVIIFSSFIHSMEILIKYCQNWFPGVWISAIDGQSTPTVQERMDIIDLFSDQEGFAILVINPEAGGVGLNITAANHVIHFNLLWNPSKEAQATARVYRPGQEAEHVFVHRLFYANTVEERMNNVLDSKREIADASMSHPQSKADLEFMENALQLSPLSVILSSSQGGTNGIIH